MDPTRINDEIASIYVHFPFCETKCHYCDFYSLGREKTRATDAGFFAQALRVEAEQLALRPSHAPLAQRIETIFFGGGTPSMTPAEDMRSSLAPLELEKRTGPETEWTMEANPSSVSLPRLKEYRALGVNRLSFGVQSTNPELLTRLGRVHSRDDAFRALDAAFEAGFKDVSVDLLCGVPGQSLEELDRAITELTSYPITHLSCYLLTLVQGHKMFRELPAENAQLEHLLFIDRALAARGFEHYEISNFAKPGRRARHNLRYWTGTGYVGLGPSAHSFDPRTGRRWKNVSSLTGYSERLMKGESPVEWTETLTHDQKELERWMLALRLSDGFPENWLSTSRQKERARTIEKEGWLERHPERAGFLRLTPRGMTLSDQLVKELA